MSFPLLSNRIGTAGVKLELKLSSSSLNCQARATLEPGKSRATCELSSLACLGLENSRAFEPIFYPITSCTGQVTAQLFWHCQTSKTNESGQGVGPARKSSKTRPKVSSRVESTHKSLGHRVEPSLGSTQPYPGKRKRWKEWKKTTSKMPEECRYNIRSYSALQDLIWLLSHKK